MKVAEDFLLAEWNPDNTSGIKPKISSGWYDFNSDFPQVTVTGVSENVIGGGDTGYNSINLGGTAPTQIMGGEVAVNCWAQRGRGTDGNNPKTLVYQFSEEVKRIIRNNHEGDSELETLAFNSREQIVDNDSEPTVFRFECMVGYIYLERS